MKTPILSLLALLLPLAAAAQQINGFDLSRASIPLSEIFSGGPPRDGIPAIDAPRFVPQGEARFLRDDDIVLSLTRDRITRAYPLRILVWHEIVNDVIAGEAVAVTYCPLCGTAMVFDRRIGGKVRRLGVSGLLYQSDVLMYDRESESLWSQLKMEAVSGPAAGSRLTLLPSEHLTWRSWRAKYPSGEVLSTDTGHRRDYGGRAYAAYFASDETMFPVSHRRAELRNKEWVVGVIVDGRAKAYPASSLPAKPFADRIGDRTLTVSFDPTARRPEVKDERGGDYPYVVAFWFAWQAFYPETELWNP